MGMAASQARFLGLTARKSNVEYQGQQVNQQRTALSNESANLYNQMLELEVPTPPKTAEFTETKFVLEDSASSNTTDYTIADVTRTYNSKDEYEVVLACEKITYAPTSPSYKIGTVSKSAEGAYSIKMVDTDKDHTEKTLIYDEKTQFVKQDADGKESNTNALKTPNKIYKVSSLEEAHSLTGFDECFETYDSNKSYYFYTDGKNYHFLTQEQLDKMTKERFDESGNYIPLTGENQYEQIKTTYKKTEDAVINVKATLETSKETGRYSSIKISTEGNDQISSELKGREFKINTTQVMNQSKYDDAMSDYEYKKAMYEKSVSDINSQTEIVQKEDQQLELRLQQLNTEQNAIKTEMDSVQQVIKDNVEKTFKVFA